MASYCWIPKSDEKSISKTIFGIGYHNSSNQNHRWIKNLDVTCDWNISFTINRYESLEHLLSWNTNIVNLHPTIIFGLISELWTHITSLNSWHMFVILKTSELNQKWTNTIFVFVPLTFNDELSKNHCIISISSKITRPPFGCWHSWSIQYKFIGGMIKGRSCFKSGNIWSMSYFCLCICPKNIIIDYFWHPFIFLFFIWECLNWSSEHCGMEPVWWLTLMNKCPEKISCWCVFEISLSIVFAMEVKIIEFLHPSFLYFTSWHFIVFMVISQIWILFHFLLKLLKHLYSLLIWMIDIEYLICIKIEPVSFLLQLSSYNLFLDGSCNPFHI